MGRSQEALIQQTGGYPLNRLLKIADVIEAPDRPPKQRKVLFLDIETEPIVCKGRKWIPPKPTVACTLNGSGKKHRTFWRKDFLKLRSHLRSAELVVTFNGDQFDFRVLARELGVRVTSLRKKSFDLMAVLRKRSGWSHSLNNLAYVNLGEPKRCRNPERETGAQLAIGCRSDVIQLRSLFLAYVEGHLKLPRFPKLFTKKQYAKMPFGGQCPVCRDVASVNVLPQEESLDKEWEAAIMAPIFGEAESRALIGLDEVRRCFSCATLFLLEDRDINSWYRFPARGRKPMNC